MDERPARSAHRKHLGPSFNEAARRLWISLDQYDGNQQKLADAIGVDAAMVNRWLYGERKPSRESASKVERVLKIDQALWDEPSRVPFEPPAAIEEPDDPDPPRDSDAA